MQSVILVASQPLLVEFTARLGPLLPVALGSGDGVVVERCGTRVYVCADSFVASEYGVADLERIKQIIPAPVFHAVDYSDRVFARDVLLLIADDPSFLVDNDHGLVLPGDEFVRRLRDPEWRWDTADR